MNAEECVKTRKCTQCNAVLPESNFYKTTLKSNGKTQFQSACKSCFKVRTQKSDEKLKKKNNGISRSVLSRKSNMRAYASHIVGMAKARSEKKGLEFSIDADWFLSALEAQDWKCAISGHPMEVSAGSGTRLFNGISIDRIDNSKGYTAENCWLVCYAVNAFKGNADLSTVVQMCRLITEKWDC